MPMEGVGEVFESTKVSREACSLPAILRHHLVTSCSFSFTCPSLSFHTLKLAPPHSLQHHDRGEIDCRVNFAGDRPDTGTRYQRCNNGTNSRLETVSPGAAHLLSSPARDFEKMEDCDYTNCSSVKLNLNPAPSRALMSDCRGEIVYGRKISILIQTFKCK
ncbi:unnamed protein product [Pleuronectes platessa]|uniref:Uncharacterized protein n=1 Tax=Pleuronectes platessa TaxID=8262 RepID=A0A9N7ZC12_PLEPL|nr:unnamed protein product [Pleuronectes platessa]